jgi:imidazolonepropionase-like amidohydrolase
MKNNYSMLAVFILLLSFGSARAQETFPRNDVKDTRAGAYALTNATIVVDHLTTIQNGTLLVKSGKIEQAGANLKVPAGYTEIDLKGKFIYPSMVDIYSGYGLPAVEGPRGGNAFGGAEQIEPKPKGAYNANEAIRAHYNASDEFTINATKAEEYRNNGFGSVLTFKPDGIARGTSAFVTLADLRDNNSLVKNKAAAHYSFNRGTSTQNFPRSMMGYIALLRQTYLDAEWYNSQMPRPFADQSLEAWVQNQKLPQIFEANEWHNITRADKVGDEFGVQYIIKGGGDEYKRIDEIKATNASLIIPVNFPEAYDVEDPLDAAAVSLADMKHWEMAPTNAGRLEKAGVNFALTSYGLKNVKDFIPNVRKAMEYGLSEAAALQAVTSTPAKLLKVDDQVGSLKKGMLANFVITSGKLFADKMMIYQNWVQGQQYIIKPLNALESNGKYTVAVNGKEYTLEVTGDAGSAKGKMTMDTTTVDATIAISNELITISYPPAKKVTTRNRLSGWKDGTGWKGKGQTPEGEWFSWTATRKPDEEKKQATAKTDADPKKYEVGKMLYPFTAHGLAQIPVAETILIKNATVWTNEAEGVLKNTDVLLKDGKILKVGQNLSDPAARVIDGTGKHVTPGIIDEHSHIGAASINDVATNSSMVRIGDNIDSEDIDLYRALAGGVVAVQVLHGSANPIGGQSALIKLRWGEGPEKLKIAGADQFIKFALGENVKRTGNTSSIRYPQTRMGVEQVYVDAFTSAREYEMKWNAYNSLPAKDKLTAVKPRRDLAEETMLEILNKKRFITCHSYVQSEINMLMNVAESFNFRINTFTHILEGYKVADKMKAHGVAASTFSDWWNYKWEVRYAIPYNAAIMHKEGVLVAINSDDANMGRRLNQEAAKSVKYGGMSEEDALKMVTLNPARILHLDNQMGSLKPGKSADVVLWSDHPLSVYAKAEKTIVDGKVYFDIETDKAMNKDIELERMRLIQKMKGEKKSGGSTQRVSSSVRHQFHCEDVLFDSEAER